MLGFGLSEYIPYLVYGLSFCVAFICIVYRSELGILFIASLLPVYIVTDKALKLDLPFANSVIDIVIIAMLFGWLFRSKSADDEEIGQSPMMLPIFLMMGYTLFSFLVGTLNMGGDILGDVSYDRLAHWKNYMIMPVLYIISYYNLRSRKWKYALFVLLFVSLLVSDLKFRQEFQWYKHDHYDHKYRVNGTLGLLGPNEWGAFHTIYTMFFIGLFMVDKQIWRRVMYGALIVMGSYSLIYSYSRGAYVGLLVGLLFVSVVRSRKLLIPLVVCLIFWKSLLPMSVVDRIESTFLEEEQGTEVVTIGDTHVFTAGRSHLWEKSFNNFLENPLFGTGYKTFSYTYDLDTHNVYMKFLAEQGIIGLSLFLLFYALAFKSGWRLYRQADEVFLKAFGFGFLCAVVGSIVVNLFGDRWTYFQIGGIYWVLWALVDQENGRIALQRQAEGLRLEARKATGIEDSGVHVETTSEARAYIYEAEG